MKKLFIIFFAFTIAANIFAQKKNEFRLVLDTIELKNFGADNYFVRPPWDYAYNSQFLGKNFHYSKDCMNHVNQSKSTLAYLTLSDGIPIKKLDGFVYFNPGEILLKAGKQLNYLSERQIDKIPLPNSLKYLIDSSNTFYSRYIPSLFYDSLSPANYSQFYQPFYMKKAEVTNKEYREFVNYVMDSLAKKMLGGEHLIIINHDTILNWKIAIDWNNQNNYETLQKFFLPETERFYKAHQLNAATLIYDFKGKAVKVYPDTNSWVNNFEYSFNQPMTQMYFWHPVFDYYPVVGITQEQALAYCDWKEKQLRNELAKNHPLLEIEIDLPSMTEWESVIINSREETDNSIEYFVDNNYITDLTYSGKQLESFDSLDNVANSIVLRAELYRNSSTLGELVFDHSLHTIPAGAAIEKSRPFLNLYNMNKNKIHNMGNNVSEWTNVTYNQWSPIFWKRQEMLEASHTEEGKIVSQIEKLYDKRNDKNGTMIIGGNWIDERISVQLGQPLDGVYAKTFINPDSAYCTVGFRYVVRVKLKSDTVPTITPGYHFNRPLWYIMYGKEKHWKIQLNDSTSAECFGDEITLLYQPYNTKATSIEGKITAKSCDDISIMQNCQPSVLCCKTDIYKITFASNEKIVLRKVQ
jgi:formylglycine-generating enzyme required for sulfatase activity